MILTIMYDVQYNAIRGDEMDSMENIINMLTVELKRGSLVLIVLSQLRENEYGYSLVQKLEAKNVPIEAGTLYPLLRRLEKQNLLISEWDTSESRPRKFYKLSNLGEEVFVRLKNEWISLSKQLDTVLKENNGYEND
jgi:PadR family transcriptional regulator, regulatory protein PadR